MECRKRGRRKIIGEARGRLVCECREVLIETERWVGDDEDGVDESGGEGDAEEDDTDNGGHNPATVER